VQQLLSSEFAKLSCARSRQRDDIISVIALIDNDALPPFQQPLWMVKRRSSMTKHAGKFTESHRYELVHGEDADFIAYQRKASGGHWLTISSWMIPSTTSR
jgi:hypothetical protein